MIRHNKHNLDKLQEEVEEKYKKREKKRKPRMKVVGAGVKKLQRIISKLAVCCIVV